MVTLGQGHGDAHPCIPQVCTEASLSAPLGGTIEAVHMKSIIHDRSLHKPGQHLRRELDDDFISL